MTSPSILKHTEHILRAFEIEPRPLDQMVDAYYRRYKNLGPKERQIISDAAFGVMRWKRRLDGILSIAGIDKPANKQRIAACLLWQAKGMDVSFLQEIIGKKLDFNPPENNFPGGMAAYCSFPDVIFEQLLEWKGKEWAKRMALALNEKAYVVIRTNLLKIDRESLQGELFQKGVGSTPTIYSPFGLILSKRINLASLASFRKGLFEVQDEASQIIGLLVHPLRNETVLDVCAGGGGKSLLLSMLMGGRGRVISSDINARKLGNLRRRVRQMGCTNINIIPSDEISRFRGRADAVLIDAPCSGTGTLRRNPDLKWRLTEDQLRECISVQKALLEKSAFLVKPNGRLIYATCSVLPRENEEIVDWFTRQYPWKVVRADEILKIPQTEKFVTSEGYFKTNPCEVFMDGFFGCILKRV